MFYLISNEYVGPNEKDSRGNIIGDSETIVITKKQGTTNMSNEPISNGWLGTTNDWSSYARGEFSNLDDALAELKVLGFTSQIDDDDMDAISAWQKPRAALEKWGAGEWLIDTMGSEWVCNEYNITENTSDEQLIGISDKIEAEATKENINLFGCLDLITELRDELRD